MMRNKKYETRVDRSRRELLLGSLAMVVIAGEVRAQGRPLRKLIYLPPYTSLISFAPEYVAKAGGFFEREGLDVTIGGSRGATLSMQQVVARQALICRSGSPELMTAILNEGVPLVAIATLCQSSPFGVFSKKTAPVGTPEDMKGKVIGVASKGGTTEKLLDAMLVQANIDPASVRREVVGESPGAMGVVEAGRISAFIAGTSTKIALEEANTSMEWFPVDRYAPMPGQVISTLRATVQDDADTLVRFLRAVRNAVNFIVADSTKDKTLELLAQFQLPALKNRATAKKDVEANMKLWLSAGQQQVLKNVPDHWQKARDIYAKTGAVKPGPATDLYTNDIVEKATS